MENKNDELIRRQDAIDAAKHAWAKGLEPSQYIEIIQPVNSDLIQKIEEGIKATGIADDYSVGMCNGMKWCKSLLDGKEPKYDIVQPKYKKRRR